VDKLKYIVITSAENKQSKPFENYLGPGYRIINFPMIRTEPIEIPRKTFLNALDVNWMVFTSQNAVRYYFKNLNEGNVEGNISHAQIGAIGDRTAELLNSSGMKVTFVPSEFNRKILSEELPVVKGQKVSVFTSSETIREDYKPIIRKGASLDLHFIYSTKPNLQSWDNWNNLLQLDPIAFCFLSASAVTSFFNQVRSWDIPLEPDNFTWGAIGPATFRELRKWITVPVTLPESTNLKSLLQAIWKATSNVRED
jgi:uroporphyrinogen-III synthase